MQASERMIDGLRREPVDPGLKSRVTRLKMLIHASINIHRYDLSTNRKIKGKPEKPFYGP
jgi:hypothetical protein